MSSVCSIAFHLNRSFNHLFFNIYSLSTNMVDECKSVFLCTKRGPSTIFNMSLRNMSWKK